MQKQQRTKNGRNGEDVDMTTDKEKTKNEVITEAKNDSGKMFFASLIDLCENSEKITKSDCPDF